MHTTNLRKVGGSIMLAVPPAFLNQLHLQAGTTVGMIVSGDHLVIGPNPKSGRLLGFAVFVTGICTQCT
jgi:antitoxin ChpS